MSKAKETTEKAPELSYFDKRMKLLGITPADNKIGIRQTDLETGKSITNELPIFRESELGIEIVVYTIDRLLINYKPENNRWSKNFAITRLKEPKIDKNGNEHKYHIPKGAGTYPFFPPQLIEKFEKKIPMKTVYVTEGYFKAFKGAMNGLNIIGLSSITHMKDKATGALHEDIVTLVKSGLVERFVWLTDGDCLDISSKEITESKDLYTRPFGFYSSITNFKTLLDGYDDIEKWFMHINSDGIIQDNKKITRDQVKGLDDLLINMKDKEADIIDDIQNFGRNGFYFNRFNITAGMGKIWRYFHLGDVNDFFLFHSDRRPELKNKEFKFHGTQYVWNEQNNTCDIKMPGAANLYFRVGDFYYKFIEKPNQHKQIERTFVERKKTTLTDDHGKGFCKHVPKYEDFCNVPDHSNFQQVIHNCFNVYSPLDYEPDDDECTPADFPNIMNLVKHIWGSKKVSCKNKETGDKNEYENWELGLDYLQMLYTDPSQKLPILCLVSKQNKTGKSTLGFFLRAMLGANVAIVGNADLANDFNAHWATKSVVVCDETKIDKHAVIEKIKNYSTALKIYMNAKGKGQVELDCFIKFILITNNEETFITANEEDTRYWVLKVPQLQHENPKVMSQIVEEIPAFLSFLNKRKLATQYQTRMWFADELIKTDALRRVIAYSEPTIVKEIRQSLKELFLDTGYYEIMMTAEVIMKELLPKKIERNYLHNVLQDKIKVQQLHVWTVETRDQEYATQEEAVAAAEIIFPDFKGVMALGKLKPKYKTCRYTYPSYIENYIDGVKARTRVEAKDLGRPYVFKRRQFVSEDEDAHVSLSPEDKNTAALINTGPTDDPFPQIPKVAQGELPM